MNFKISLGLTDVLHLRNIQLLREVIGVHTCDRRSSKSSIETRYKSKTPSSSLIFEPGFSDYDELWSPTERESTDEQTIRLRAFLDDIVEQCAWDRYTKRKDRIIFMSFSSHSGAIKSILRVLGHRPFRLETGGVIPALVKIKKKS